MPERLDIIRSTAGRDKDAFMVVLESFEGCIIAADGHARPIAHPKKKNPRHTEPTGDALCEETLRSDRALRRALRQYADSVKSSTD